MEPDVPALTKGAWHSSVSAVQAGLEDDRVDEYLESNPEYESCYG